MKSKSRLIIPLLLLLFIVVFTCVELFQKYSEDTVLDHVKKLSAVFTPTPLPTNTLIPTSTIQVGNTSIPPTVELISRTATPNIKVTAITPPIASIASPPKNLPTPIPTLPILYVPPFDFSLFYLENGDLNPEYWQSVTFPDLDISLQVPNTWSTLGGISGGSGKVSILSDVSLNDGVGLHGSLSYAGRTTIYSNPEQKSLREFYRTELHPNMISWYDESATDLKIDNHIAVRCACFISFKGEINYLIQYGDDILRIGFGPFNDNNPFQYQTGQIKLFDTLVQSIRFE